MAENELKHIPLSQIRENPTIALRRVDRSTPKYAELVDSVSHKGVLNAISVREVKDPETGDTVYGLIDGLHRFSAASDAGLKTIPASVISMTDGEVLEAQIIANVQKIETKPMEYTEQLCKLLAANPTLTEKELAARLDKSTTWLSGRLGLLKLIPGLQELVQESKINLSNAVALAKLPQDEQTHWADRAMTNSPAEFVPAVQARAKEIKDAKRQGRSTEPGEFVAVAHIRKLGELKSEYEKPLIGPSLLAEHKISDPTQAFQLGVQWALHLDPRSIDEQKAAVAARKKELEDDKQKRAAERAEKKQKEAAEALAKIQEAQAAAAGK